MELLTTRASPTLELRGVAVDGSAQRVTIYAGELTVGPARGYALSIGGGPATTIGLYVPGSQPVPAGQRVSAGVEMAIVSMHINLGGSGVVNHGISGSRIQFVPDNVSGGQWMYLSFEVFGPYPLVATYRVTTTGPA